MVMPITGPNWFRGQTSSCPMISRWEILHSHLPPVPTQVNLRPCFLFIKHKQVVLPKSALSRARWFPSLQDPRPSLAPTLRHPTFITASVCSSSQPTKAWPDSWNATIFCSSFERILLFLAVPERMPRSLGPWIILYKHAGTFLAWP